MSGKRQSSVKYLYATSKPSVPGAFILKSLSTKMWSKEINFMEYIAVATDEGKAVLGEEQWRPRNGLRVFDSSASLPVLSAVDIVANVFSTPEGQPNNCCLVTVFAFGCRVGDANFLKLHDMETVYLHGTAGIQGLDGDFRLEVRRSIALANKFSEYVKDEYLIPTRWRNLRNKEMIQNDDGSWSLDYHDR
ncbi:phospholipase A1-IIgamma-like [Apium graveolens]|uniref:phospholipase A1-IIgamma-like n=1 Tax=Apium graveolens TaxID=4045 RepID=UPI003D79AEDF